jgi:hypothetical protein
MTPRLLAEIVWQPVSLLVGYGVYRILPGTGVGRAATVVGTVVAVVAMAWVPVAAWTVASRIHHDSRLAAARVENAGAGGVPRLVPVIRKLRALIPPGDTYRFQAYSSRISFWAYTSLLPRIAVGPSGSADWRVVWNRRSASPPSGAVSLAPGVWAIHTGS